MICLGNICRSPLAEGIMKSKLPANFTVDSAGTIDMHEGKNPDLRSIKTAFNNKIDISQQKSRPFSSSDFDKFDRIFCMDKNNLKNILALAKTEKHKEKVSLILENNQEVPDPYYGKDQDFEEVFQLLNDACEKIAKEIIIL